MRVFEIILGVVLFMLIGLRLLHVVGSDLFLVIGLTSMSMLYLVFGFLILNEIGLTNIFKKAANKDVSSYRIIGSVVIGWVISFLLIAILFKLQIWEGGDLTLKTGLNWLVFSIIVLLMLYVRKRRFYLMINVIRLLLIGSVVFILYGTSNAKLVDIYYKEYPEYAKAFKEVLESPNDQELKEKWINERKRMDAKRGVK